MIVWRTMLREQRRALIGWTLGVIGVVAMYAAFYPSITSNAKQLNTYLDSMPEAFKELIGGAGAFTTPRGYLQGEIFSIMAPLLLAIYAIGSGARAIAGEEQAHTLDLLLANPIGRGSVVLQKLAALTTGTVALGVVLWLAILLLGRPFDLTVGAADAAAACVATVLLGIDVGALALAVGCWRGSRGLAVGIATAVMMAMYLLDILAPSVAGVAWLQRLSLLHYSSGSQPITNGLDPLNVAVLVGFALVAMVAAVVSFDRRDLAV